MIQAELIQKLEKVSSNLRYMLLDDTFNATKEERIDEIRATDLILTSCIEAINESNPLLQLQACKDFINTITRAKDGKLSCIVNSDVEKLEELYAKIKM